MMAMDRLSWAPVWSETHSRSYGSSEDQAHGSLHEPGPK